MYTYKVMIHPNNKQETKIRRTLNKCIECNNIVYDYLDSFVKNGFDANRVQTYSLDEFKKIFGKTIDENIFNNNLSSMFENMFTYLYGEEKSEQEVNEVIKKYEEQPKPQQKPRVRRLK